MCFGLPSIKVSLPPRTSIGWIDTPLLSVKEGPSVLSELLQLCQILTIPLLMAWPLIWSRKFFGLGSSGSGIVVAVVFDASFGSSQWPKNGRKMEWQKN